MWWIYLLTAAAAALIVFIAVILIRTAMFKPHREETPESISPEFDGEYAVKTLAEMIKCRTVSSREKNNEDEKEFDKFKELLPKLFPETHKVCEREFIGDRAVLYKWKGRIPEKPAVFMAHFDVVSVVEENWSRPPFDAVIEDGVLWGRGTLDTKGTLNGVMSAAENLIKQGFIPEHDIYFSFAGDEEISGYGAPSVVDELEKRGIKPELVIDEGGAVVENVFPGVKSPCALVGIAEKGPLDVKYEIKSQGGHASAPPPHTAVGKLSAACVKIENKPFKMEISKAVREMFDTLGRHSTFVYRMIFANLWCFKGVLDKMCRKKGGELNALMRTTVAFTQMEGSKGSNVLPPYAKMVSNLRLNGSETVESAVEYLRKTAGDADIDISVIYGTNPSLVSDTSCESWRKVKNAISCTWPEAIVSPYLMVACSDSRHFNRISDKVYRFSAMALSSEERAMIHGNDERVPLSTVKKTVEFYINIMKMC